MQQRQGALERHAGRGISAAALGAIAGPLQVGGGTGVGPGQSVVLGDEAQVFAQTAAGVDFQPAGDPRMVQPPGTQQDRLVGHFAQQIMFEGELGRPGEGRAIAPDDQFAPGQRVELAVEIGVVGVAVGRLHIVGQRAHGIIPEDAPDDGRPLEHLALLARQAIEAGLEQPGQRGWNLDSLQTFRSHMPDLGWRLAGGGWRVLATRHSLNHPLLNQHLHQLFDVERVALGPINDEPA